MKLSAFTIYMIGIALAVTIASFGIFYIAMPNNGQAALYRETADKMNDEAAKQHQADQRVAAAIKLVKSKQAEWAGFVATRSVPGSVSAGGVNLAVNAFQLTEDTRKYRNSIQLAVNNQLRRGGVKVVNGPLIPLTDPNAAAGSLLASFYNYPVIPFPVVIFDLGTVTVQGTYAQIMNNVRAWKSMPHYLAVTDGLRLDGTSPHLTGTYSLSIVGYLQPTKVNGQAPEGAASGSSGASSPFGGPGGPSGIPPGARMGPPGGFPGGGPPGGGKMGGRMAG